MLSDFTFILYTFKVLTETLFTFWLVCFLFIGVLYLKSHSNLLALLAGLFLALLTLTRPIAFYLLFVALAGLLWLTWIERRGWKAALYTIAAFSLLPALMIGGWGLRNQRIIGYFSVSPIAEINLAYYRAAGVVAMKNGISLSNAREEIGLTKHVIAQQSPTRSTDLQQYAGLKKIGGTVILQNSIAFVEMTIKDAAILFIKSNASDLLDIVNLKTPVPSQGQNASPSAVYKLKYLLIHNPLRVLALLFSYGQLWLVNVAVLFVLGWKALRRQINRVDLFLVVTALYFVAVSAGPESMSARFRLPVMPAMTVFAAWGICRFWNWIREQRARDVTSKRKRSIGTRASPRM